MSDYWFFLSYARRNDVSYTLANDNDKNKKLVRRFYEDLAGEIISRANTGTARTVEQIGFFDQLGIEPGDKWDDTVAEALRTARVMLCHHAQLLHQHSVRPRVRGVPYARPEVCR